MKLRESRESGRGSEREGGKQKKTKGTDLIPTLENSAINLAPLKLHATKELERALSNIKSSKTLIVDPKLKGMIDVLVDKSFYRAKDVQKVVPLSLLSLNFILF